ncbi:hypothetical protein HW432_01485 [Bacillus pumilus]|uniref:hypothetical protein n=1 Tax=Bacillus pumilus TaxID=1408 RepID=UPI0016218A4C|nr:hypothetical protein [Bacillus pumilus]MBB6600947.1 hypothetical protein [Bacillus pumilus]
MEINVTVWLSIATCITAATTCFITYLNYLAKKPNLTCEQMLTRSGILFKPDREDLNIPDVYWQDDYRIVFDIVIANRSENPISIVEFTLNEKLIFNSYSRTGKQYKITTDTGIKEENGIQFFSSTFKETVFDLENSFLNPIIDIPAHSSVRGYILFRTNDKADVKVKQNILRIKTTKKIFKFNLDTYGYLESRLPPPKKVLKARNQKFQ